MLRIICGVTENRAVPGTVPQVVHKFSEEDRPIMIMVRMSDRVVLGRDYLVVVACQELASDKI
jgi:hypothetical protein